MLWSITTPSYSKRVKFVIGPGGKIPMRLLGLCLISWRMFWFTAFEILFVTKHFHLKSQSELIIYQ